MSVLITRETDYALRVLRALNDGQRHTMKALCETEEIPQQFAYKIIRKLADAGMITSTRGVNGGCQMKADMHNFTLHDLINTINPDRYVNACMNRNYSCTWKHAHGNRCNMHEKIKGIQNELDEMLRSYVVYDLIRND